MMKELPDYNEFLQNLDKPKAEVIYSLCREIKVEKGTFLLREGQTCHRNYLIRSGVARKFFCHEDKEITTEIYLAGDVAFAFESSLRQTPSVESIVAVTALDALCIDDAAFVQAKKAHAWLVELDLLFTEQYTIQLERRLREQYTLNAAERYKKILHHYPALIQSVPLKIIASYLNVTVERLSRIRATL